MGKERLDALGKSIIKDKCKREKGRSGKSSRHTVEKNDGYDWSRLNLTSVTEQNNLDEFLEIAELAGAEFTAEKLNITFVATQQPNSISKEKEEELIQLQKDHVQFLQIPRKPIWNKSMSAEELHQKERDSFLKWRQELAKLEKVEGLVLTPFEKNLELWRQLWRVVEKSDVVIQIVDARNPLLFFCEDLANYIREVDPNKKNGILLNKSDLLEPEQRIKWIRYFESVGLPAVTYSALKADQLEDDSLSCNKDQLTGSLLTRQQLLEFFKSLTGNDIEKNDILTVGFVGYPNVGKSSTINSLYTSKKASVSATPGKTKHYQTLFVESDLCLCDCPGLVMPSFVSTKAELIVNGILPIDQMHDHIGAISVVLSHIPRHILQKCYGILFPKFDPPDRSPTVEEFLNAYGYIRGFMTQRGLPDHSRTARYVLKDYVKGKLLYCHAPPGIPQEEYHKFSPPEDDDLKKTSENPELLKFNRTAVHDLDESFFKQVTVQAHIKGINKLKPTAPVSENSQSSHKPWKKHHNRNKREKLRRVYAALDQ